MLVLGEQRNSNEFNRKRKQQVNLPVLVPPSPSPLHLPQPTIRTLAQTIKLGFGIL
jgi:hypothetical protein